ncbi:ATP-dependent DNA helicase [Enterococcus faecium]|uniref:ATP-dependent DNA helicase n=1 Tax=Enterococcus faecium TaxID=1352 RepID=UPI00351336DC
MNITKYLLNYFEIELPKQYGNAPIRTEQVQMALDVEDYLFNSKKDFLFIDAPVGTGKSMGVLIPTLIYSQKMKRKILYSTATINLQKQIMKEELPKLQKMGLIDQAILAMGKSNYTCRLNFEKNVNEFSEESKQALENYFNNKNTGQISEIEKIINSNELNLIKMNQNKSNSQKNNCGICSLKFSCNSRRHRKLYKENDFIDMVVTNHDQMIVSNNLFEVGKNPIVPITDRIIIIDEAHLLMENYLAKDQTELSFSELIEIVAKSDKKLSFELKEYHNQLINKYKNNSDSITIKDEMQDVLRDILGKLFNIEIRESMKERNNDELLDKISSSKNKIRKILDSSFISWIDIENKKYCAADKNFLKNFYQFIKNLSKYNKVIFMSGTLTGTKKKEEIIAQWGVSESELLFYTYKSPYNYADQARVYIPRDLWYNNDSKNLFGKQKESNEHLSKAKNRIREIVNITNGNLLVLCTSKEYMYSISDDLNIYLKNRYTVLTQGEKSVDLLTEEFKEGNKVLIGAGSFFTGFSIKGKALTSVVISKLPFPTNDNPLVDLLSQNVDNDQEKFNKIIFPLMLNKLNQAIGRLIRSTEDYGIISILDSRVYSKTYGKRILKELGKLGYNVIDSLDGIVNFYEKASQYNPKSISIPYDRSNLMRVPKIKTSEFYSNNSLISNQEIKKEVKKTYTRQKSSKDLLEEKAKQLKFKKNAEKRKKEIQQRNEIRYIIQPLEEFRRNKGIKLFTQNQRDEGLEKCFLYTIELIKQKYEDNSNEIIDELFDFYPFESSAERENLKKSLL